MFVFCASFGVCGVLLMFVSPNCFAYVCDLVLVFLDVGREVVEGFCIASLEGGDVGSFPRCVWGERIFQVVYPVEACSS